MNFPKTQKENIEEKIFDTVINDPYRWLENGESRETKEWVDAQNAYIDLNLRNETFEMFSRELTQDFKITNFSNPIPCRGKYFFSERQPDEDQFVVYVKEGIHGTPIKLVDPNGMNSSNTVAIDFWSISRTGKYLVYGLSHGGDEMPTMYIKDIGADSAPEQIPRCKNAQARWLPDDSGFYYKRNPQEGAVPRNEEHLHSKVYFHQIGQNPENDELIFGEGRPKDDMLTLAISLDGRYLAVEASRNWTENEIYIYDRENKQTTPLIINIPALSSIFFLEDKAILYTNYEANNYRTLSMSLNSLFVPIEQWQELIPEREVLLRSIVPTRDKILADYLVNACSKAVIFDQQGKEQEEIPLPPYSNLTGISARREEHEFFYGVESFTFPKVTYRYIPDERTFAEYRRTQSSIDSDEYIVKQEWYSSKDGTKIPLFIFHRKDLKTSGFHPTILYGYGGFGHSLTPLFNRNFIPWIKRNGIFAVANIRGGAEFGEEWHKQGIKENKQNSFDDFIAAAEYLIKEGYTDRSHLGILGGSNGGLLVSAVETQRPELFKAVCSRVPLADMVRFPLFGMASRWVHEYGDPNNKEDLLRILKWSPYHTTKEGIEYPATFFTTADKDSRVNPLHARKMAAMLQSINKKNSIFIFTEMEAGHGPGKPITKTVESWALILTFFAKELGLG
ncbi:MAG: prolyl oligopeptidase family serine peptidase [Patescibacteria group bacterium]